jgi:hypothetical protein
MERDEGTYTNERRQGEAIDKIVNSIRAYNSVYSRNPQIPEYWMYLLSIRAAIVAAEAHAVSEEEESPQIDPRWAAVVNSPTILRRKAMAAKKHGGARITQKAGKKLVKINGGEKFRIEDASKNWTMTNRYKKWVSKLTRKSTEKRHTKSEDLCVGKDNICEGDLGIARKYMPQFIGKDDVQKFRNFIKRVYNIKSCMTRRKARDLKPTQKEISRSRIEDLIENENILNKVLVPLVISRDNYVVDGHHRWAAYRLKKPNRSLPAVEIDAPIKDVLGISIAWGAKHQDF